MEVGTESVDKSDSLGKRFNRREGTEIDVNMWREQIDMLPMDSSGGGPLTAIYNVTPFIQATGSSRSR